jgi:hypothetical protein
MGENRVPDVRAMTMSEDAHPMSTGTAPQDRATICMVVRHLIRAAGWTKRAAALRHARMSVTTTRAVLGVGRT